MPTEVLCACIQFYVSFQKMPESERIPVLFLFTFHKAPSLAFFSCNGCATLGKGPKTEVSTRQRNSSSITPKASLSHTKNNFCVNPALTLYH